MRPQRSATPSMAVAQDVRRLIAQAERGEGFDFEIAGHAYDVMAQAAQAIAARINTAALPAEIERRVEDFARSKGSAQTYLRLVVTDIAPDLPEYDPSEVILFDGTNGGVNFSTADVRLTNAGTVMTSVNITDLRAYFESGRKRILVAYLGTDRNADAQALDRMLEILPAALGALGMDAGGIQQVMDAVRAGNIPPVMMKLLTQATAMVQIMAQPQTPETRVQLAALRREIRAVLVQAAATPGIAPVLVQAVRLIAHAPAAARIGLSIRPGNDNARTPAQGDAPAMGKSSLQGLVKDLRALARDKTLLPEQRREIAAALRDLRAGLRKTGAMPARIAPALMRLSALVVPVLNASRLSNVPLPRFVMRIAPRLAAAMIAAAPRVMMRQMRSLATALPPTLPQRGNILRALQTRTPARLSAILSRAPRVLALVPALVVGSVLQTMAVTFRPAPVQAAPVRAAVQSLAVPASAPITASVPVSVPVLAPVSVPVSATVSVPVQTAPAVSAAPVPASVTPITAAVQEVRTTGIPSAATETVRVAAVPQTPAVADRATVEQHDARPVLEVRAEAALHEDVKTPAPVITADTLPERPMPVPPAPEKAVPEKVVAEKTPAEKASTEKPSAEKSSSEKPTGEKPDGEKMVSGAPSTPPSVQDAGKQEAPAPDADKTARAGLPPCCQDFDAAARTDQKLTPGQEDVIRHAVQEQSRESEAAHLAISTALEDRRRADGTHVTRETQEQWNRDLADAASGAKAQFDHVCGDGCTHGGSTASAATLTRAVTTAGVERNVAVTLVAANAAEEQRKTQRGLLARSIKPA